MFWSRNRSRNFGGLIRNSPESIHWGYHSPESELSEELGTNYQLDFEALNEFLRNLRHAPTSPDSPSLSSAASAVNFSAADDDDDGMSEPVIPKYNGELGKQQEAFFTHVRTHFGRMCLRKSRVLQFMEGYGQLEFLDMELRIFLGADALPILDQFLLDA